MSFASSAPQSFKVVHFLMAEEQISYLYHICDSPRLLCSEQTGGVFDDSVGPNTAK